MKKVLYISYIFPPMAGGGVYRVVKTLKYLPSFGWDTVVLTAKNPIHWAREESLLKELPEHLKIYKTLTVEPFYLHVLFSKLGLGRPFDYTIERILPIDQKIGWLPHSILKGVSIVKKERIDIIYTTSPPHSSHLVGFYLKRLTDIPWIADFRDPWTQAAMYQPKTNLQRRFDEYTEQKVLNYCDIVIANTEGNRTKLAEKYKVSPSKVVTITNGYDESDFTEVVPKADDDKFVITYTGSFYQDYSPLPFIEGMKRLLQKSPFIREKVRVIFIGKMSEHAETIKRELEGLIEIKDFLPHKEALRYMVDSGLLLLILPAKPGAETWYPGKIFEYMASGTPILALVPDGIAQRLIEESRTGFTVDPDNAEAISEKIYELYKRWESGELTTNPNWDVIKRYERKSLTQALAAEFDKVLL